MAKRWTHVPVGSRSGELGPDDHWRRMNLVTPATLLQGVAEVKEGRTFCLSLPLDVPGGQTMNPAASPRVATRCRAAGRDARPAGQRRCQGHRQVFSETAKCAAVIKAAEIKLD